MTPRLSLTFLIVLSVIILPWWLSGFFLLMLVFRYPWYYEAVFVSLIYDLLYGLDTFWITMVVILCVPLAEWLKKRLYVFN
jgi:hypothetical protein